MQGNFKEKEKGLEDEIRDFKPGSFFCRSNWPIFSNLTGVLTIFNFGYYRHLSGGWIR